MRKVRASGAEAIAISLLFSFANPQTEKRVEAAMRGLGLPISTSHRILPEFREYERASTTVVNAYLAPRMQNYLQQLEQRNAITGPGRSDAILRRHPAGAAGCPGASPHGVIRARGRSDWRVPGSAMGRVRTHYRLRYGRDLHGCIPRRRRRGRSPTYARISGRRRAGRRAHARHSHRGRGRWFDRALRCRR